MKHFKLSFLTFSLLSSVYSGNILASVDISNTSQLIQGKTSNWFADLRENVITHTPEQGSKTAEWDRLVSNEYRKIKGERLRLAEADKNQNHDYVYGTYMGKIFGDSLQDNGIQNSESFKKIESLYKLATYAKDPNTSKNRSIDFILKDDFRRGRPYQVIGEDGNYKNNYTAIKGSSYPSGHTFNGFRQAATLAILFPEKADEIFDRAIEYGESRVIVGAHFGTDTIASRVANYYTLAQLLFDDETAKTFVDLAKEVRVDIEKTCGNSVRNCISQTPDKLDNEKGYYKKKDPEDVLALTPEQIPERASALLRLRFPYLKQEQMREILASTAYPSNSLAGWNYDKGNSNSTWGLINLPAAYNGPTNLNSDFEVNQDKTNSAYDIGSFTSFDIWRNDIGGLGGLIKKGDGTLALSGNNTFDRVSVESGHLMLTGINKYKNTSSVSGGSLVLIGELNSDLDVKNGGEFSLIDGNVNAKVKIDKNAVITGSGVVKKLDLDSGSTVAPGGLAIGKLGIKDNINFEKDATYLVNVATGNKSDLIESENGATIHGGKVKVSLENKKNLLSEKEVNSLIGLKSKILSAKNGLKGEFDVVEPNYLFLGTRLEYDKYDVVLHVERNDRKISDVATTGNNKNVADALDDLKVGNSVLESVVTSSTVDEINRGLKALSGQIYADVTAHHLSSSRYLRDAGLSRLQNVKTENNVEEKGLWADYLYSDQKISKDGNASGYNSSTNGFFLGGESSVVNDITKIGLMAGYTRSSIDGDQATAKSDNFHLGVYGGTQIDKLIFKAGYGFTLHDTDTQRSVVYMNQIDQNKANYKAYSNQIFAETGYAFQFNALLLEPFVNLSYVNYDLKHGKEKGGAASLELKNQNQDLTTSTVGVHLANQINLGQNSSMKLKGTLGWQHYYGDVDQNVSLAFSHGGSSFNVNSVPLVEDSAVINLSAEYALKNNISVSLGYNGLISSSYKDNSIKANLTWLF